VLTGSKGRHNGGIGQAFLRGDLEGGHPRQDRIGYRFRGGGRSRWSSGSSPSGPATIPKNIVDSCFLWASIKCRAGIEHIVLHASVSGGGYFMFGTLIAADMDFIG